MKQTALFALFVALAMTATTSAQVTYTCTAGTDFNEYEGIAKLFDGDTDTKFCGNAGDNVYALVTASEPVFVWGYEMTTANDNEDYGRLLTQWVLYGTNDPDVATDPDASGWVTLSDPGENGIVQMRNFYTQRFFCEKEVNKPFKYFKLVLKKGGFVQLSEFKILGETHRVIAYKWKESSDNNSQKATDLLVTQKWEGCNLAGNWVTLEADDNQPHAVKGYSFTTSDDGSWNDRAPKSWKIEGSNDYTTWTLIDEVTDDGVIQNMNFKTFDFTPVNTSGEYRYIRLTLTAMRGTGWTQVGEFHVLSTSGVSDAVYYTNLVNKAKAAKTDYEALLGADDAWCQEYAVFFAGLDLDAALATAKSTGDYAALEDKLTAAENHAIAQALKPLLSGGSYIPINGSACWGDGHYSQLLDGKESTKWGGNFPGEGDHVQYVIFRAK